MGDVARRFHRKDEIVWRFFGPAGEALGPLQRIKCAVDLDAAKHARGVRELAFMRQPFRIEDTAPRRIGPPRNADADVAGLRHGLREAS